MAHWRHDPARVLGNYTIEVSKVKSLFLYLSLFQADAIVESGINVASVGPAQADPANIGDDTAVSGGVYDDKDLVRPYTVTVIKGGELGEAQVSWTTDRGDDEGKSVVPKEGLVAIGTHGIQMMFNSGADLSLTPNNKWVVQGQVDFEAITALNQHVVLRGADLVPIALAPPDATQPTFAAALLKLTHETLASVLGWTGQIKALEEM